MDQSYKKSRNANLYPSACQYKITCQGFEHMLPWTDRCRIAHVNIFSLCKCTNDIRYDAVPAPIATSNNITGAGTCQFFLVRGVLRRVKKRIAKGTDN